MTVYNPENALVSRTVRPNGVDEVLITEVWDTSHPDSPFVDASSWPPKPIEHPQIFRVVQMRRQEFEQLNIPLKEAKMTDIVERLNEVATTDSGTTMIISIKSLCTDAIAEIMRLRTTVEQLRAVAGAVSVDGQSFADIKRDIGK